jgi:metal-responsive CopG/Arc/MetJ family transcriptional regulator
MVVSSENKRIIVTLPQELYEKLQKLSDSENRSVSNMAATIIKKHFESKSSN